MGCGCEVRHAVPSLPDMAPSPSSALTEDDSGPRLTVAAVARRLGVAPATLRTWARRYGLGPTEHSAGSHRRYTAADLRRLDVMRRLTLDGVAPAEAARTALDGPDHLPPTVAPYVAGGGAFLPEHSARPCPAALSEPERPGPGGPGGRVLALPGAGPAARGLARAAMSLDAATVLATIRASVRAEGVVATWEALLRPVLVAAGQRWAVTGEGVDVEHLLAECCSTVLREVASTAPEPANGRPVLLVGVEGDTHGLPLHTLAAALAERGVGTRVLGPGLPEAALHSAVRRTGPAAVFVWAQLPGMARPESLEILPVTRPPTVVVVGGAGWSATALPSRVRYADSLQTAVDLVLSAIRGPSQP